MDETIIAQAAALIEALGLPSNTSHDVYYWIKRRNMTGMAVDGASLQREMPWNMAVSILACDSAPHVRTWAARVILYNVDTALPHACSTILDWVGGYKWSGFESPKDVIKLINQAY